MNSNLLRGKIAERGLSQAKVAREIGVSAQSFSRKITGKREFRLSEVQALCEILSIENPADIFLR